MMRRFEAHHMWSSDQPITSPLNNQRSSGEWQKCGNLHVEHNRLYTAETMGRLQSALRGATSGPLRVQKTVRVFDRPQPITSKYNGSNQTGEDRLTYPNAREHLLLLPQIRSHIWAERVHSLRRGVLLSQSPLVTYREIRPTTAGIILRSYTSYLQNSSVNRRLSR